MISGLLSLAGAAILVVIDQLIKHWATAALLPVGSMDVLPGVVELRYCLNDGMAFSMLAGKQGLLIGMTSVMLLAVLIMLFVRKMPLTERAAWTLVLGGGVGNLIDRMLNGVVVDYINVLFMRFAIFNFADICVCVGVGLLVIKPPIIGDTFHILVGSRKQDTDCPHLIVADFACQSCGVQPVLYSLCPVFNTVRKTYQFPIEMRPACIRILRSDGALYVR